MSDKKKQNLPTEEERKRMVDDAIKSNPEMFNMPPERDENVIVRRAKEVAVEVNRRFKLRTELAPQILFDRGRMTETLAEMFIEEFKAWSKEELIFIVAMLYVEAVIGAPDFKAKLIK